MNTTLPVLYLSYDGMTDPLGQSQVIPYLAGLSAKGYHFTLVSCEKPQRFKATAAYIRQLLTQSAIDWQPLLYTKWPPVLSTIRDVVRMQRTAMRLHKQYSFKLVHCRSYISSLVGLQLKKRQRVPFIFDMRGFWADERVDGGLWNLKNPIYRSVYNYFKKKETAFIQAADAIISLTEAGREQMYQWPVWQSCQKTIDVIPCCADFELFALVTEAARAAARSKLNIPTNTLVISYLGSLGTWYLLDEMLVFFAAVCKAYPEALFLFITPDKAEVIYAAAARAGVPPEKCIIRSAGRAEVPKLAAAADVSLCFIKPAYSKLSSSPTKLGELLAMGIPVIANEGVGDVADIIKATGGGICLRDFSTNQIAHAVAQLPAVLALQTPDKRAAIREKAFKYYDLAQGIEQYYRLYERIIGQPKIAAGK